LIKLEQLISSLEPLNITGQINRPVSGICFDSRQVKPGEVFVAIQGLESAGNAYQRQAIQAGAAAIVSAAEQVQNSIPFIQVKNARTALARLAAEFYGCPEKSLNLIGVTGTNGKTTTTYLIKSILEAGGHSVGLLGTIEYVVGNEKIAAERTTPESLDLQRYLATMRDCGQTHVVMEVSSHALTLERTHGLNFERAVFTNFSHEHLDFHKTSEAYLETKTKLFAGLNEKSVAILNFDDPVCRKIQKKTRAKPLFFSAKSDQAEINANILKKDGSGMNLQLRLNETEIAICTSLIGGFNLNNILAAAAVGSSFGVEPELIKKGIEAVKSVPGRMESVETNRDFQCLVDFPHTPESLKQSLLWCREICSGKVIVLFGCGGERDQVKRPKMGKIAAEYADIVYLTSDNPRREEPLKIIEEIDWGISEKSKRKIIVDRKTAINEALNEANENDVVLIAGRGHETYQEIGGERLPFDDRQVAKEILIPTD